MRQEDGRIFSAKLSLRPGTDVIIRRFRLRGAVGRDRGGQARSVTPESGRRVSRASKTRETAFVIMPIQLCSIDN